MKQNKYISPGGWFSFEYPAGWNEFEDTESTFLFCNPRTWDGNFRISATRGRDKKYGADQLRYELKDNPSAVSTRAGSADGVYSAVSFEEDGRPFTSYSWILDYGHICVECTFTTVQNGPKTIAEDIISTIHVPGRPGSYHDELIPVRVIEIGKINAGFEWTEKNIKKALTKDFTGSVRDITRMDELIGRDEINMADTETQMNLGLTLCAILAYEIEGMEWRTLIDGSDELPVVVYEGSSMIIRPDTVVSDYLNQNPAGTFHELYEIIKTRVATLGAQRKD